MGKQLKFLFLAILTTLMVLSGSVLQIGESLVAAQPSPAVSLANQLYVQYPDIPRAPKANTTLLSRFIAYHLDSQQRPAQYHLDWELSMADYLGAAYSDSPGKSTVTNTDKLAMQRLSRQQRYELVHNLEQHFAQ